MVLKGEQADKDIQLSASEKEERQKEFLLATMWIFYQQGREEVSIAEFQESVAEFQKTLPSLGYSFSERFLLSPDLLYDLKELDYKGFIRDYQSSR